MGPDPQRPAVSAINRAFVAVNLKKFFAELKRRKVYTVAIAYVVGGWALAQGISQLLPVFDIPIWVVRLVVLLIVLGFPVALVLSWFFDLVQRQKSGPEGNCRQVECGPRARRQCAS